MTRSYPVEVLWCGNGHGHGWSFPPKVRRQIECDTAGKSVLHLFGGRATFGTRLDLDPIIQPDVIGDAWLAPFGRNSFDVVIIDPPYTRLGGQEKAALFRGAAWIARERVVWFSTVWVNAGSCLKTERAWVVRVGDFCHVRCLIYFRVVSKPDKVRYFKRGPGMKYNRWLAQPQGLPLSGFI